jgi:hypothetical protein
LDGVRLLGRERLKPLVVVRQSRLVAHQVLALADQLAHLAQVGLEHS